MPSLLQNAKAQFIDINGAPLVGGSVDMFYPGTENPKDTYQDPNATTKNTNPIILDEFGQAIIWGIGSYRQVVYDKNGNLIWDRITQEGGATGAGNTSIERFISDILPNPNNLPTFTAGTTATLTLANGYGSATNIQVFYDGGYQQSDQYGLNAETLTLTTPIPLGISYVEVRGGLAIPINSVSSGAVTDGSVAILSNLYNRIHDFISVRDSGAKCDGITDDTAALQRAIAACGSNYRTLIIPGPCRISAAVTFGANTMVFGMHDGAIIGTAGTELVQVQAQPIAGRKALFTNCKPRSTNGMTVYPEWFGAVADGSTDDAVACQTAIDFLTNTGGIVDFAPRTYNLSVNLNIGAAAAGSAGQNTVLKGSGVHSTILQTTGAATGGIQVLGVSGTPLQGIAIKDMSITKNVAPTGGVGIYAQYGAGLNIQNVQTNNFLIGVSLLRSGNTICEKVTAIYSGTATNWRGFNLDGGGTGAGGNASSVFRDCYVTGPGAAVAGGIGFFAFGAYVSDLLFEACETQAVPIGFEFDCSTAANTGNEDVQLINCRTDSVTTAGVYINAAGGSGSADSMFTIIGGWFNSLSTGSEVDLILLNGCQGVTVQGAQLYGAAGAANLTQVKMVGCQGCKIIGNTFREFKYGVYMTGGGRANRIADNDFYCASGTPAAQMAVGISEAYSVINDNTFRGYGTNGAVFDSTSTSCGMVGNNADPANITTRYSNASTGTPYTVNNIGA